MVVKNVLMSFTKKKKKKNDEPQLHTLMRMKAKPCPTMISGNQEI